MAEHTTTTPPTDASGGYAQMDDINIPLVAVAVGLFAVTLAVLIVALQAWFMNAATAEANKKILRQEDPRMAAALTTGDMQTEVGKLLQKQRAELRVPPGERKAVAVVAATGTASGTAGATVPAARAGKWMAIDDAMRVVAREYSEGVRP